MRGSRPLRVLAVWTLASAVGVRHFSRALHSAASSLPISPPADARWNGTLPLGEGTGGKFDGASRATIDPTLQRDISAYETTFDKRSAFVMTQLELLRLWLDVPHRGDQQVVVLALDEETAGECSGRGQPYLFDADFVVGNGTDMKFKGEDFLELGLAKFSALKSVIVGGYSSVLFSEIDVIELRNPNQCEDETKQRGCVFADERFDVEIQPNIPRGEEASPGSELNIGFFCLRSSASSIELLDGILSCLEDGCGWDQSVFTSRAWGRQCCHVDENDGKLSPRRNRRRRGAGGACEEGGCLRLRVLGLEYFPTGGDGGVRRKKFREFGVVDPRHYVSTRTCPVLVHCTGRTGLYHKLLCAREVRRIYGNCRAGRGVEYGVKK